MGTNYNADFFEPTSAQTFSNIASTASALTVGYFIKNIPDPDFVPRLETALEAILFAAGGEEISAKAGSIIEDLISDDEKIKNRQNAEGFDSQSQFGIYVSQTQAKLSSDAGAEQRADVVASCVALGLAIRSQDFKGSFEIYALFSRMLTYFAHAHGKSYMMTYGNMESLTLLSYEAVVAEAAANVEESGEEVPMTSFAFEDLTEVFTGGIDIDVMKDSELQSYKVEAEMIYSDLEWKNDAFCEDVSVPVRNINGKITGYQNVGPISYPCIDESHNIAPVTGTKMSRTTVAVPPAQGTYSSEAIEFIEKRLRANYPPGAFYGSQYNYYDAEEFKHADGTWLVSYVPIGNTGTVHGVSACSHFESYNYVNDHETTDGNPWNDGYRYGACYDNGDNYMYGYAGLTSYREKICLWAPNQCADHNATGDYGEDSWVTAEEMCNQHNGWWNKFNCATHGCEKCGFSNSSDCSNAGGTWSGNSWVYTDPYEIPAPSAFPEGYQRDMSLRHHVIKEGEGFAVPWWKDFSIIERTGFAILPLEFTVERLSGLYGNFKVNPIVDPANVGRRAFSANAPTIGIVDGTVGPPQPSYRLYGQQSSTDEEGAPFAHAQVVSENKTFRQPASISITPGWMWKFYSPSHQQVFHTMETGSWNLPLSQVYYHGGFSDVLEGKMDISFESNEISNFYDKEYITGNEIHPPINHTDLSIRNSGREGRHNQDLTTNRFFAMGDNSQDYPIIPQYRLNANFQWTFYTVPTGIIPTGVLFSVTGSNNKTFADMLASDGAEWLYESTTLGVKGSDYWDEFVTGYIYTGDDSNAGAIVSCMHEYTGYSTTSSNTINYWWIDPNIPSTPPFPYSGFENGWFDSRVLATRPNISKCRQYFPYTTTTTPEPTTTTTVTTTTCDPSDPNCDPGGGYGSSTTTTTTEDPLFQQCNNPIKVQCPYDCDSHSEGDELEFCNYEQCVYATCGGDAWDTGIYPEDWGWAPLYGKQRSENPPRYWRGPFASTRYKFMYPNASGAFNQYYENELQDPEFETLISGFPSKIKFDVYVEEYISKDICSGGYVESDGSIILNEIIRGEDGELQPSHQKASKDVPWANLVDENYSPESPQAEFDLDYGTYTIIHDISGSEKRNSSTYDQIPSFCAGNKVGSASGIKYLPSENTDAHLAFGGYYRYSGYDFDIEATYAKPSFSLETYSLDFSSIIDALSVRNEFPYKCDEYFSDNMGDPGNQQGSTNLATYDPVHFLKMVSDSLPTGTIINDYLANPTGENYETGYLLHPHKIYGDHWMGLRSGCLFNITGNYDWQGTGLSELDDPCGEYSLGGEYNTMQICEDAAKEMGMSSVDTYPQFAADKVFLFNIGDNEINVHFRRPVYVDGWELDDGMGGGYEAGGGGTIWDIMATDGCPAVSKSNYISLTGLAPISVNCSDGISTSEELCCTNNDGSWINGNCQGGTATWADDGSVAPPWKQLNLFRKESSNDTIAFTKEIIRNEGLLFEKPTGEWSCSGSYYETITEHGARIAQGVRPKGCSDNYEWDMGGSTTTTAGPVTTTEQFVPPEYLRVSGWREISQLKITFKNFEPYMEKPDALPNDSWFIFQQSGSCKVTGYMSYENQEEACIYTEGIVLEDRSDDPWFHLIDYPHYASDVLKRDTFTLPSGDLTEHPLHSAPSRMLTRWRVDKIEGGSETGAHMLKIKSDAPENYNKFLWPTISDLYHYNGGDLSWESIPPEDGHTYHNSYLLISADAGQPVDAELTANKVFKRYAIVQHWGIYDSMVVDPLINPHFKIKLTKERGGSLGQTIEPKGGYIVPLGTTCWDIKRGLISGSKQGEQGYVEEDS